MKGWLARLLILTVVIHLVAVFGAPRFVMFAMRFKGKVKINNIHHEVPITPEFRDIPTPSPDLLYSACPFDVSEKPLLVTATVPDTYFSISAYAFNTDNFFVINDRQIKSNKVEIVIKKKGTSTLVVGTPIIAESPSSQGVVIFRTLIKDDKDIDKLVKIQKQANCKSIE